MTKKQENQVAKLIEKFDFQTVRNAMLLKGWVWSNGKTPTVEKMKQTIRHLFDEFFKQPKCNYYGTGGLAVKREDIDEKESDIKLTFTLESQYL